jgi:hypothetical protein
MKGVYMLTVDGSCYMCDEEIAARVAGWAGLDKVRTAGYAMWQDYQTAGGGCRIVWKDGYAFVSRHSGYAWADCTEEVRYFLLEQGAKETTKAPGRNPHVYGDRGWREHRFNQMWKEGRYR